jgi:hypothetical protein
MWWSVLNFTCQGNTWVPDLSTVGGDDNDCSLDKCSNSSGVVCGTY